MNIRTKLLFVGAAAMSGRTWSAADDARLRELYPVTRTSELPALLGRSRMAIKVRAANMHLRKDPSASMRREWDANEDAVLRMTYPGTPTDAVAALLDRTLTTVYQRAQRLGLAKSAAFMASPASGRTNGRQGMGTRFQKGHATHNKGKAFPTAANHPNCRRTQFKRGQKPAKWMPVGSTRLVGGYEYTKVSDRPYVPYTVNWKPSHVLLWERKRGRIPKGHALVFKDGDRTRIRLGNLKLIPRADLMRQNTLWNRYPKDVARAIQLLGALNRKINRRTNRGEEQARRSA